MRLAAQRIEQGIVAGYDLDAAVGREATRRPVYRRFRAYL
jgi:hypothetical protein